ncbi:MAG: Bug family tripartite tricarboxylate transporter substrate binding protein [Reyranella sp.]|uniref:Bug family tripartite tricarboxylate transporter substrate binding protein n=1 Tax=Reyranella sp. TaxID=1929291 RepID=UPI003D0E3540
MFAVSRRLSGLLLAVASIGLAAASAGAQSYPSQPIRFIVGFSPGASTDLVARYLAEDLRQRLGQPVVVENRTGANGSIAATMVARAAPDGYTILISNASTMTTNHLLYKDMKYDPLVDLTPVAMVVSAPFVLVVNPNNPKTKSVATFADFVKLATSKPDTINYGTGGVGNLAHLSFELLGATIGARMVHVPYAGAAPAQAALLSSEVDAAFDTPNALPLIQSGRLKALAVSTTVRWRDLPDVPSVAESGYPSFATSFWTGVVAPSKTPQPVIDALYKAVLAATEDPKTKSLLLGQGNIEVLDSAAFRKKIAHEGELNAEVLKKAGIQKQ